MSVNKVIYNGNSLIDLTEDTVTPETLAEGVTAHDKSGAVIIGTMRSGEDLEAVLTEQAELIDTLQETLRHKASGGGGGDSEEAVAALLGNTMTELDNSIVTSLRTRACQGATKLVTVNLPLVTSLGSYAFYQCSGLETVKLPKLTSVSTQVFYSCTKLQHADCGQLSAMPAQTFNACSALTELILRKSTSICTLSNVNAINNSPIGKGTGYIYVPSALVDSYKTATNWSTFANQFRAIEDYPEICGGEA